MNVNFVHNFVALLLVLLWSCGVGMHEFMAAKWLR